LADGNSGTVVEPFMFDVPDHHLAPLEDGGFALRAGNREPIRVQPVTGGWRVSGPPPVQGWTLRRGETAAVRFELRTSGAGEPRGRSMPLAGDRDAAVHYVLLDDGRLFRVVLRGPRDSRFEMLGWETPGAYLVARPQSEGWTIAAMPACGGLQEIESLLVLFAAEILDAEDLMPGADEKSDG